MTIDRNYYRVYTKSTWDGNPASWVLRGDLYPVAATRTAAPGVGTATVKKLFGAGYYEDLTALPDKNLDSVTVLKTPQIFILLT